MILKENCWIAIHEMDDGNRFFASIINDRVHGGA